MSRRAAPAPDRLQARIARGLVRARAALLMERLWPRLVLPASLVGLFLTVSWLGLWPRIPDIARFGLVGLFAVATLAALVWALRTSRPTAREAMARLEARSDLRGQPLEALSDTPFDATSPEGRALWQAHQARMARTIGRLSAGAPAPRTELLDRWALRAPVLLLLVVAFFVAGPQRGERLLSAFAPPAAAPTVPVRIDVWATPPAYTGLPPRTLVTGADLAPGSDPAAGIDDLAANLPAGSRLTVLASDLEAVSARLEPAGGGEPLALVATESEAGGAPTSLEADLTGDAVLAISGGGAALEIPLVATPDTPPAIAFTADPGRTPAGALTLAYEARDDYGLVAARADIAPAQPRFADAEPVVEAPAVSLTLPPGGGGTVETTRDLSAHPWAGLPVTLTLHATDGAGQEGRSQPRTIALPLRPFSQPLALALVEQRRLLAVDRRTRIAVLGALEALAMGADSFMQDDLTGFLALTVTTQKLRLATSTQDLEEVVEMLWLLALEIEDGDLAAAAERLRQAEEALSDALERGADDEEIARLMAELRQALEAYMQDLAQRLQGETMPPMAQSTPLQMLDPQAMQDLMDQIQSLSEMGAADAARQMLEELRRQLDALRGAQAMQPREPSPQEQAAREAMQQLQAITREQQRLLDETFPFSQDAQRPQVQNPFPFGIPRQPDGSPDRQAGRDNGTTERPEGGNPPDGDPAADPLDELAQQQRALQEQLQALMDQLSDLGLDAGPLGEAEDGMQGAGSMLDRGSAQGALPEQGRALDALRQGAQDLARQMIGEGEGEGEGQAQGQGQGSQMGGPRLQFGPGQGQRGVDPLGRPQRATRADGGERVRIPEESDIQRARDILTEIQRRLGERSRPPVELDYLDRLIDRF